MKVNLPRLSILDRFSRSRQARRPVAVAQWDRTQIRYLVANPGDGRSPLTAYGSVARSTEIPPLRQLAEHFEKQAIACSQVILLLSRSDLELLTLNLPPAEAHELPSLVHSMVEQQMGDSSHLPIIDYLEPKGVSAGPMSVMAFLLTPEQLSRWQQEAEQAKLNIVAITSRQLAPLGVLWRHEQSQAPVSVAISIYAGEAELIVIAAGQPLFLRSLRIGAVEPELVAEQIGIEIQRSMALVSGVEADEPPQLYLFGRTEAHEAIQRAIQDNTDFPVILLDSFSDWPLEGRPTFDAIASRAPSVKVDERVEGETPPTEQEPAMAATSKSVPTLPPSDVALAGAAWDALHNSLLIDLLSPKKAPPAPNPYRRWYAIGAGFAALLLIGAYTVFSDLSSLRDEVEQKQTTYDSQAKLASKFQEKSDELRYVEGWLEDQVNWLNVLGRVADRLPRGQHATVRRLNASVSQDGGAMDLIVQVSSPEEIAEFENDLRDVKFTVMSKHVSERTSDEEFPWQFETRISFEVSPPARDRFRQASRPKEESP